MKRLVRLFFVSLCVATAASGAVINATSCSSANVQGAINSASTGDTVVVPAGNCTWTSTVSVSGKAVTLQGAGIGVTNITDGNSGGWTLDATVTAVNFVRVTGFSFLGSTSHSGAPVVQFEGNQGEVGFRFDHNRILTPSSAGGNRGIQTVSVYGLIDHNTFDVTDTGSSDRMISLFRSDDGSDGGFTPWTRALSLGTNNAVYIEDNTFNYGSQAEDSIDAYAGARLSNPSQRLQQH